MKWLKHAFGTDEMQTFEGPAEAASTNPQDVQGLIQQAANGNRGAAQQIQTMIQAGQTEACEALSQAAHQYPHNQLLKQLLKACGQAQSEAPSPMSPQNQMQPPTGGTGGASSAAMGL